MSYQTYDGRSGWQPTLSDEVWTCDCGHENPKRRHTCMECGLAVGEAPSTVQKAIRTVREAD